MSFPDIQGCDYCTVTKIPTYDGPIVHDLIHVAVLISQNTTQNKLGNSFGKDASVTILRSPARGPGDGIGAQRRVANAEATELGPPLGR